MVIIVVCTRRCSQCVAQLPDIFSVSSVPPCKYGGHWSALASCAQQYAIHADVVIGDLDARLKHSGCRPIFYNVPRFAMTWKLHAYNVGLCITPMICVKWKCEYTQWVTNRIYNRDIIPHISKPLSRYYRDNGAHYHCINAPFLNFVPITAVITTDYIKFFTGLAVWLYIEIILIGTI